MDLEEAIYKRRTIRRFKQEPIPVENLKKLVDYARVAPAAANVQGLEYYIVNDEKLRNDIFPNLAWAAGLPAEMRTPEDNRRPMAYIIVLLNTNIKKGAEFDTGAAVENILLGAVSMGYGACWMGAIKRDKIAEILQLPKIYEIKHVISIGVPDEESQTEVLQSRSSEADDAGIDKKNFKYWKDKNGKMHVPKRVLDDVIFKVN